MKQLGALIHSSSVTPRNQVSIIGELSGSAQYFCGDGIRRDNENGGFNANSNQTTVGGVGVRQSSGDPSSGCYLGHGSNEGNYEGWYNNGGNANSQGYTTWGKINKNKFLQVLWQRVN